MRLSTLLWGLMATVVLFLAMKDKRVRWHQTITWDVAGYYSYLPATLIYKDLAEMKFYEKIDRQYKPSGKNKKRYSLRTDPNTKKTVVKYTSGVAILQLPFFLVAHIYALLDSGNSSSGYSYPYQLMVVVSTVFYVFWGLWFLMSLLRRHFSEGIAFVTMLLVFLGTNIYFYARWEAGLSHQYSFWLYCGVLNFMDRWHRDHRRWDGLWMALMLGMVVMIRPTNVFLTLFPLLWWTQGGKEGWRRFWSSRGQWPLMILLACIPMFVHMSYWKSMTGDWFYYSYQHERFVWTEPQIWKGLFSYRKGWFVYTPMALVGVCAMISMWFTKKWRFYALLGISYFVPLIYVVFCWSMWFYGGSYGCRVMIESLTILALPLAFILDWLVKKGSIVLYLAAWLLVSITTLNVLQSYQYRKGIIHWSDMNKEKYWDVFGKLKKG